MRKAMVIFWDACLVICLVAALSLFANSMITNRESLPKPRYEIYHQFHTYTTDNIYKEDGWVCFTDKTSNKRVQITGTMSIQENKVGTR